MRRRYHPRVSVLAFAAMVITLFGSIPAAAQTDPRLVLQQLIDAVNRDDVATQLALDRMQAGVVVTIASVAALGGDPHPAPEYAAAKSGAVRLTSALRARDGVRLVCVCPDSTRTPAMERTLATKPAGFEPGPMLEPREVAAAVVDLIRDDTACGRVIVVRAGEPIQIIVD